MFFSIFQPLNTETISVGGAVTGSEPHQEDLGIRRDRLHTEASDGKWFAGFCRDEGDESRCLFLFSLCLVFDTF